MGENKNKNTFQQPNTIFYFTDADCKALQNENNKFENKSTFKWKNINDCYKRYLQELKEQNPRKYIELLEQQFNLNQDVKQASNNNNTISNELTQENFKKLVNKSNEDSRKIEELSSKLDEVMTILKDMKEESKVHDDVLKEVVFDRLDNANQESFTYAKGKQYRVGNGGTTYPLGGISEALTSYITYSESFKQIFGIGKQEKSENVDTSQKCSVKNYLDFYIKLRGMTKSEVAEKVGINKGTLSNVIAGKNATNIELCLKLSKVLEVPVDALFYLDDTEETDVTKTDENTEDIR